MNSLNKTQLFSQRQSLNKLRFVFYHLCLLTNYCKNFTIRSRQFIIIVLGFLFITGTLSPIGYAKTDDSTFTKGLQLLTESNYKKKETGIDLLTAGNNSKTIDVFKAMLTKKLYFTKKNKVVVFGEKNDSGYEITAVLTGENLGLVEKQKLKKIKTNNRIRTKIKENLSRLNLNHADPAIRLESIQKMLDDLNEENSEILIAKLKDEKNNKVRESLLIARDLSDLKAEDPPKRLNALENLSGCLVPVVYRTLTELIGSEEDESVKKEMKTVLAGIESRRSFYSFIETFFFGLSQGSILVLAAIGLAITFGVIGVINMAHGELIMIGSYTTYVIQLLMPESIGLSLFIAVPAAFIVSGLLGIIIERTVIKFLYGRPLETLLATFGISLVLQQTVRSIFSPLNRSVKTPEWMSGSIAINEIFSLTMNRIVIMVFLAIVFSALYLIMKKTSIGLKVRAVSQNRNMARAMGVHAARVDALTFGLGSGIAGVAGVALSQLTNVGPNLGQAYIIDSFMVVVFGGVGNLWGTLIAGLSLGTANKFIEPFAGAVLAKIVILVFIILFIQKRPRGLFPQKGRAAVE